MAETLFFKHVGSINLGRLTKVYDLYAVRALTINAHQFVFDKNVLCSKISVNESFSLCQLQSTKNFSHTMCCHILSKKSLARTFKHPLKDWDSMLSLCNYKKLLFFFNTCLRWDLVEINDLIYTCTGNNILQFVKILFHIP